MIKEVIGNILDCTEDIIIHQVNADGIMRCGISKTASG